MKKNHLLGNMVCIFCFLLLLTTNSFGQTLYENLSQTSKEDLAADTEKMSGQIIKKFNQESMEANQQKIYFYEYFSNLKKLVLYGAKLANYAEFEQDLKFAKENELFKGLPEKETKGDNKKRTKYVNEKYKMMQTNIKDEIDTYKDLIQTSLDTCEQLSMYELTGSSLSERNKDRIRFYLEGDDTCKSYFEKREQFATAWPSLEAGIKKQMEIWQEKGLNPEDPIIDRSITKAISNDDAV